MTNKQEVNISSKVFVGNLSYDTSQSDLEILFSEVGQVVQVFLPSDRMTGRPRGFAFIEFNEDSSAEAAIEKYDGHELDSRAIRVSAAEDKQERSSSGGYSDNRPQQGGRAFQGPKRSKPKGSRRNIRAKKRGGF